MPGQHIDMLVRRGRADGAVIIIDRIARIFAAVVGTRLGIGCLFQEQEQVMLQRVIQPDVVQPERRIEHDDDKCHRSERRHVQDAGHVVDIEQPRDPQANDHYRQ